MNRVLKGLTVVAVTAAVTGCSAFSSSCHEPQDYQQATSVPALKVPEGLNAPPTRGALKIPDVPQAARTRGATDPCLDEPPSFYPNRPKPGAKPPAKSEARPAADASTAGAPAETAKP